MKFLLLFLSCFFKIILLIAQPITKDSVLVDTTIIQRDPFTHVIKVYVPFKTKQANHFFIQAGYENNLTRVKEYSLIKDSTIFKMSQNHPSGNFHFETGYFTNILRFSVGIKFKEFNGKKSSVTTTSQINTNYFTRSDTIDSYLITEGESRRWEHIIRTWTDSVKEEKVFTNYRNGIENIKVIEIPVSIGVPFNLKKIFVLPEIGISIFGIRKRQTFGDDFPLFNHILQRSGIYYSPHVLLSAGYPIFNKFYLNGRVGYKLKVNSETALPALHSGVLSYGVFISCLF